MCEGMGSSGLRALEALAKRYGEMVCLSDVRIGQPLPKLEDFDILLSSGGPGDPTELGSWGQAYADLITAIRDHNKAHPLTPKRAFLVCHSFQVMSHYWGLGQLSRRDAPLWGVAPQYPAALPDGAVAVFPQDTFYTLESRFYQVMPTHDIEAACAASGIVIAARDEKGALTAWQTADGHIAATQFHPEALAPDIEYLLDHPLVGEIYPMHMCDPAMLDFTRANLERIAESNTILTRFLERS